MYHNDYFICCIPCTDAANGTHLVELIYFFLITFKEWSNSHINYNIYSDGRLFTSCDYLVINQVLLNHKKNCIWKWSHFNHYRALFRAEYFKPMSTFNPFNVIILTLRYYFSLFSFKNVTNKCWYKCDLLYMFIVLYYSLLCVLFLYWCMCRHTLVLL